MLLSVEQHNFVHVVVIFPIIFTKYLDSFRRKFLYSILIEFGIPMKVIRLIKMYLNETYSRVCAGKVCLTCFLLGKV